MIRLIVFSFIYAITVIGLLGCASNPPLIQASYDGDVALVQELLKNGADVNMKGGRWDETAINAAARQGNFDTVKKLLDAGADANLTT